MPIDFRLPLVVALVAGLFVAKAIGRRLNLPRSPATLFISLPIGLAIAIVMTYASGTFSDYCAKSLNLCTEPSDTDVWDFLLYPLAFVPVFAAVTVFAIPSATQTNQPSTD